MKVTFQTKNQSETNSINPGEHISICTCCDARPEYRIEYVNKSWWAFWKPQEVIIKFRPWSFKYPYKQKEVKSCADINRANTNVLDRLLRLFGN